MQFDIPLHGREPDLAGIERRLLEADPACLVDRDPATGHLRVSTCAGREEVAMVLQAFGLAIRTADIAIVPSVCCGGCSG